jgi:hypothetical protein
MTPDDLRGLDEIAAFWEAERDGRATVFEEWPFHPGQPLSAPRP